MKSKGDKGNYLCAVFQPLIILSKDDQQLCLSHNSRKFVCRCMAAQQGETPLRIIHRHRLLYRFRNIVDIVVS